MASKISNVEGTWKLTKSVGTEEFIKDMGLTGEIMEASRKLNDPKNNIVEEYIFTEKEIETVVTCGGKPEYSESVPRGENIPYNDATMGIESKLTTKVEKDKLTSIQEFIDYKIIYTYTVNGNELTQVMSKTGKNPATCTRILERVQ